MGSERIELRPIDGEDLVVRDLLDLELMLHPQDAKPPLGARDSRLVDPDLLGQGRVAHLVLGLPLLKLLKHANHSMPFGHDWSRSDGILTTYPNAILAMESCGRARDVRP